MSKKKQPAAYDEKQQKEYERAARLQHGPGLVNESIERWNTYSKEQQEAILAEGKEIYGELAKALEAGLAAQDPEVQAILQRWHDNLRHFYEPTLDILRGLGEIYKSEPGFVANFEKLHPALPEYLSEGIAQYVDNLETAELEQMLTEAEQDDTNKRDEIANLANRRSRLSDSS